MQELSQSQLIEAFKNFITACQISMDIPDIFVKKWQVFSHFLNIYPLHSYKLLEYSIMCTDENREKKFIQDNLLNFIDKEHIEKANGSLSLSRAQYENTRERHKTTDQYSSHKPSRFSPTTSQRRAITEKSMHVDKRQKTKQSNPSKEEYDQQGELLYIDGSFISIIKQVHSPPKKEKMQRMRQNILVDLKISIHQMMDDSLSFKNQMIPIRNVIDNSRASVFVDEDIKRMNVSQLRKKITIIREIDKQKQHSRHLSQNFQTQATFYSNQSMSRIPTVVSTGSNFHRYPPQVKRILK